MTDPKAGAQEQVSALIEKASRIGWESGSPDAAIEVLRPALEKRSCQAYRAAMSIMMAHERFDEATEYAKLLVETAESDFDFAVVCIACEAHDFAELSLDEEVIHKRAVLTLANRGNPVAQTEIALHHLRGTAGFEQDEEAFREWIAMAIDSSDEIDPVCYFVEYLVGKNISIDPTLLGRLRAEAQAQPGWKEIQDLLKTAEASGH